MLHIFTACVALLVVSGAFPSACLAMNYNAGTVVAKPHDTLVSTLASRQASSLPPKNCNATCAAFTAIKKACKAPHCGCNEQFLQAQGDCLVCQTGTPQDAASVQFYLDAETAQCHADGIPIQFRLNLPPDAQAIVDVFDRQSATLRRQQMAFLGLQVAGGHIGLVVVLAFAVFSREVRRDPTFLNFCITWIFSSIVYSVLLYRGTDGNTVANSLGRVVPNTCLAQASLINGAQVMTACSTLALVIQLWIALRGAIYSAVATGSTQQNLTTLALLVSPYALFFCFAIPSVFVGRHSIVVENVTLQRVLPANFYCSIFEVRPFMQATYGVTLGLLLITAIFDALIIMMLYRHWWAFRHVNGKSVVSLSILLRVMAFSIYRVLVAVAYGTVIDTPPQTLQSGSGDSLSISFSVPVWVDLLQAAIPLVGFLVLGINNDMLNSLMFWRKNKMVMSSVHTIRTSHSKEVDTNTRTWNEKAVLPETERGPAQV